MSSTSLRERIPRRQGLVVIRTHDPAKLRYLASIGLVPGLRFSLRSCAPFNGPLRLFYEGRDEVLGAELAASIWVERLPEGASLALA